MFLRFLSDTELKVNEVELILNRFLKSMYKYNQLLSLYDANANIIYIYRKFQLLDNEINLHTII